MPTTSRAQILSVLEEYQSAIDTTERRSKRRYSIELGVRFRSLEGGFTGVGRTVNMSSGGILVACHQATPEIGAGARVEISIEWPLVLDGKVPLQLVAVCNVVRPGPSFFAAAFARHQFRTLKSAIQMPTRLRGDVVEWPGRVATPETTITRRGSTIHPRLSRA